MDVPWSRFVMTQVSKSLKSPLGTAQWWLFTSQGLLTLGGQILLPWPLLRFSLCLWHLCVPKPSSMQPSSLLTAFPATCDFPESELNCPCSKHHGRAPSSPVYPSDQRMPIRYIDPGHPILANRTTVWVCTDVSWSVWWEFDPSHLISSENFSPAPHFSWCAFSTLSH